MIRRPFGVLVGLLVLLGLQLILLWTGFGAAAPFIGLVMTAGIALGFMGLGQAPPLARVFAMAGLFWLAILLGLGILDPMTRADVPAPQRTER